VARKLALAARAGYEIMSDREEDADYIQTRINAFEFVTERSFESFIKGVLRNLFLCSNCFLLKIRKEDASPVSKKKGGRVPVAAYVIIPAHTMHPYAAARRARWAHTEKPAAPTAPAAPPYSALLPMALTLWFFRPTMAPTAAEPAAN
jgi:hypothetical protein